MPPEGGREEKETLDAKDARRAVSLVLGPLAAPRQSPKQRLWLGARNALNVTRSNRQWHFFAWRGCFCTATFQHGDL